MSDKDYEDHLERNIAKYKSSARNWYRASDVVAFLGCGVSAGIFFMGMFLFWMGMNAGSLAIVGIAGFLGSMAISHLLFDAANDYEDWSRSDKRHLKEMRHIRKSYEHAVREQEYLQRSHAEDIKRKIAADDEEQIRQRMIDNDECDPSLV